MICIWCCFTPLWLSLAIFSWSPTRGFEGRKAGSFGTCLRYVPVRLVCKWWYVSVHRGCVSLRRTRFKRGWISGKGRFVRSSQVPNPAPFCSCSIASTWCLIIMGECAAAQQLAQPGEIRFCPAWPTTMSLEARPGQRDRAEPGTRSGATGFVHRAACP